MSLLRRSYILMALNGIAIFLLSCYLLAQLGQVAGFQADIIVSVLVISCILTMTIGSVVVYADISERKKVEHELRRISEQLRLITDSVPVNLAYLDREMRFRFVNRGFEVRYAMPRERIIGMHVRELAGNGFFDLVQCHIAAGLAGAEVDFTLEVPALSASFVPSGHLQITCRPHFNDKGEVIGIFYQSVDITERVNTEKTLRTLQRQQQALLDNIPDSAWLADMESRFIAVNEAFARACGSTQAELVGKSVLEIYPGELGEQYRNGDLQVMASRQQSRVEEPLEEASGKRYRIETIRSPVLDGHGMVAGISGIARNIEERKRAEEALRESEERFRGIFEQSEDGIILLKIKSFDVVDANGAAEQLFGYTRSELECLGPFAFIAPEEHDAFISAIPQPDKNAAFHIDRLGTIGKSGDAIIVSIWGKIIRLRNEAVIFCSIRDITDRVRIEEEVRNTQARLIHANKMTSLGVLVSGIAHEINNPNTFVQGNAGILEKIWHDAMPILKRHRETGIDVTLGGLPPGEIEMVVPRLLLGLKEGARRISAIVDNLKDFAREDKASDHTSIDVNRLIMNGAQILSHHIHRHTDKFLLRLDDSLPSARGKAQQVEQVVINLIMNGLQALPDRNAGLSVATWAEPEASRIIIAVRDEGEGMTEDVLARLTEPFFSTRIEQGGTGLGLSICASIIKEHNGSLQFESMPGAGTTATVTLLMAQ